jgi:maleate isomerase
MRRRQFLAAAVGSAAASIAPPRPIAQADSWPADGVGTVARFGVLTPDFDPVPESELWAMVPRGVSIHAARVPRGVGSGAGFVEPPGIDEAIDRLVALAPRAILLGYTSSSYALGREADARVRARLEDRAKGIQVIFPCLAATAALGELGARRIAVVHPPFWTETGNEQGRAYWRAAGFDVLQCVRVEPTRGFTEVAPREIVDFVSARTPREAQAVFIGGNGMRAIGAIKALEARLGKPVLSANQILLWDALRLVGQADRVTDYGGIFNGKRSGGADRR